MAEEKRRGGREITGRHVLIGFLAAFGVVLAANLTMMTYALGGFPGLVSKSPYTEGQRFDAELKRERALGWRIGADYADGRLSVGVADADGAAVGGLTVRAVVGRPATDAEDRSLTLRREGGAHVAEMALAPGLWRVAIEAERVSDGAVYTIVDEVFVPEGDGA
jgi:nitrogen fixation protein FixH